MDNFSFANLNNGAIIEQIDYEISKILRNIQDPNTKAEAKRKLVITVVFEPSIQRDESSIQASTKTMLAPVHPVTSSIFLDNDKNGNVLAGEMSKGAMPGQSTVDENGEIKEGKIFKVK